MASSASVHFDIYFSFEFKCINRKFQGTQWTREKKTLASFRLFADPQGFSILCVTITHTQGKINIRTYILLCVCVYIHKCTFDLYLIFLFLKTKKNDLN